MKNSMFGFLFQKDGSKSRQARQSSPAAVKEVAKTLPDAKLSNDEKGRNIGVLWSQVAEFCSSSLEARCSKRFTDSDQQNFEKFTLQLVADYEEVIVKSQLNNPLVETDCEGPPSSINDTWGFPTDMVVSLTNFFLSYVCIGSSEFPAVTFPNDISETLLMFDSLEFSFSHVLDSMEELSEKSKWIMTARYNFLLITNVMSIICSWPHNRRIISHHFGPGFSRLYVQMIRSMVAKLEDVIIGYNDRGGDSKRGTDLEEDGFFLMHALLGLICSLTRGVSSLEAIQSKCRTRLLPQQPWCGTALRHMGFCDVKALINIMGDFSSKNSIKGDDELDSTASFSFFLGAGRSTSTSGYEEPTSSSVSSGFSVNEWSISLVQSGAVQVLISLLAKLTYLSRSLAATGQYLPIPADSEICKSRRADVCWSHCATLQCEVLFVLLSYLDIRSESVRSKFNLCSGAGILNSLFSMQDSPPQDKICESDFNLGYHRGLLCMNVIKEIIRHSAGSAEIDRDISIKDALFALESLPLFMAWLEAYIICHNLSNEVSDQNSINLRNINLESNVSSSVSVPTPVSDMWPWEHSKAEIIAAMYSSKSLSDDHRPGADMMDQTYVDVDLLSHGSVMLRYAEASTLMEKYIKSMQQNNFYSLSRAVLDVFEGPITAEASVAMPWFIVGPVADIWDNFFESLISLCLAPESKRDLGQDSLGKYVAADNSKKTKDSKARRSCYSSIYSSILSSLKVCAEAQSSSSYASRTPMFQFHMIHFIGLSTYFYPDETISVCRSQKLWSSIASSKSFLLGGADVVKKLLRLGRCPKVSKNEGNSSLTDGYVWSLLGDFVALNSMRDDGNEKFESNASHTSLASLDLLSKEETMFESEEGSINSVSDDEIGNVMSTEDEHDVDGKMLGSFSDVSSGGYGTPDIPFFPRFDSSDIKLEESIDSSIHTSDDVLDNKTRLQGFAWLCLFDSIFQMMSMAVEAIDLAGQKYENTTEFHQNLAKNVLPGSTTELYSMLQSIGRDTPDHIVLQTMNWIKIHLLHEYRNRSGSGSGSGSGSAGVNTSFYTDKYKHILFKCLSLCKYQLLSSCDSSTSKASTVTEDENCPPFWIGNEIGGIHQRRPFLWPARAGVIDLVVTIIKISPGFIWSKAFLPKGDSLASAPMPSPLVDRLSRMTVNSPSYSQGETNLTPKHVTLLLLLLDPRCRDVSLYILTELLHACAYLNYNGLANSRENSTRLPIDKAGSVPNKTNPSSNATDLDMSKSIYAAIFHDIIKCLFVYHIKYAMLQPTWCDGGGIVSSICRWIRSFLGNPDRSTYLPFYQSMFLSYGQLGPHHCLLNWIKPRPHIFRELFLSVDHCIKNGIRSSWDVDMKINALRQFLSMLTGLMIDSTLTKHKFSSLMLLKKFSKNKAKVVSNPQSTLTLGVDASSICNFHDVAGMIIALEKSPSLETILILFDMLLDGPKQENRTLVERGSIPEKGMFDDEDSDVCMSNMVVIPIILLLIPACSLPLQKCVLRTLQNLLTGKFSLVNLSKCGDMQPPVLDSLLDLFLQLTEEVRPLCLDLLQVIGMHNISVAQLKRIFRLMHIQSDYRPSYTSVLLRCLRGMVSTVKCPKHFFLFEGSPQSGLQIPTISKWPATTCYSFCFWFCVRSPSKMFASRSSEHMSPRAPMTSRFSFNNMSTSFSSVYRPTLLSFRQENGVGVEVYLKVNSASRHTFSLVLETYKDVAENIQSSVVVIDNIVETVNDVKRNQPICGDEWYFFAFSHSAATFRSKSEVSIMLNTHFSKHLLSYPRFSGEIKKPLVGNTSGDFAEPGVVTALTGQMGSIYMFSDYFSEIQMRKLYALGFNISKGLDNHTNASLDAISTNILLAYNPGIWNGNFFLNMAPGKNAKAWGSVSGSPASVPSTTAPVRRGSKSGLQFGGRRSGKMHAYMLAGTFRCTFCDMRDALDCLGGGRVLIPLFAQFDLPILEQDGSVNYAVDHMLALEVVKMLFLLRRDSGQGKNFLKYAGFQLISFFLERISPRHLTLELLNVFIVNAEMLYTDREWYDGVVKYILLDFKLWMFAPFEVQHHLFIHLLGLSETETQVMRELLSIRELFDALYVIYSKSSAAVGSSRKDDNDDLPEELSEEAPPNSQNDLERDSSAFILPSKVATAPKSVLVTQLFFHEVTGDVVGKRLEGKELDEVRRLIFCILFALLSGEKRGNESLATAKSNKDKKPEIFQYPTEEEIQCIMYYISHEKEDICKIQGLQLLIELLHLTDPKLQRQIMSAMSAGVKVYPLLGLVGSTNPKIRFYAFLALCNIIQIVTVLGKLPSFKFSKGGRAFMGGKHPIERSDSSLSDGTANIESEKSEGQHPVDFGSDIFSPESVQSHSLSSITSCSPTPSISSSFSAATGITPVAKSPRQNSFSFIPPSVSTTLRKKGDVFSEGSTASDSFTDIGIPIDTLRYVILWAQNELLDTTLENALLIEAQCELVITIMTRTMTGKRSTYLLTEIDDLFNPGVTAEMISQSPKNRRSSFKKFRTSSGKCSNDNLFESVFCVPAFVPVLLNFISRDVVPYSLRFSTLVLLKTKLQSFENCDLFLQIPQWQKAMFELLINEQKRISALQILSMKDNTVLDSPTCGSSIFKSLRDIEKELDRSTGILQTGLRMLCDLFLYGVEYGCPASENIVCRPADESSYTVPKPTPISMIQAIGRGERKLGVKILKETMSFLRCYAERGDLDIDLIGMSLLQQIVNSLNLRNDSWNSDTSELSHHRHIKIRVFNSACWLTTFFIVEFLTLPVVQGYSKFNFIPAGKNVHPTGRSVNVNLPSDLDTPSSRPNSGAIQLDDIKNKLFDDNFLPETNEFSSDDDNATESFMTSSEVEKNSTHFLNSDTPRPRSTSFGSYIPGINRCRSISPTPVHHDDGGTDSFWGLFGSLLSLLESINPNVAKKGAAAINIVLRAGLRNSQTMINQMNETMEEAIGTQPRGNDKAERTITGSVIPVHKLASQISWRIVRVVCNIFCESGSSRQLLTRQSQKSQLEALSHIIRTLNNLEKVNVESFEFESLHTIAKVVEVLRYSLHKPHDHWIASSFKMLHTVVKKVKPILHQRLTAPADVGVDSATTDRPCSFTLHKKDLSNDDFSAHNSKSNETSLENMAGTTGSSREDTSVESNSAESSSTSVNASQQLFEFDEERRPAHSYNSVSMSDYTLDQLNIAMGYQSWKETAPSSSKDSFIGEVGITWSMWEEKLQPIVEHGVAMEDVALSSSLTELGMHKQTEQIEQVLSNAQSLESNYFSMLSSRSDSFMKKATEHEMNSLQRLLKTSDTMNKRNAARWATILEELANERGPWGVGAEEAIETYWTFDMREDSQRRRFKLCRNAKGSNHSMATFFLNPPLQNISGEQDTIASEMNTTDSKVAHLPSSVSSSTLSIVDADNSSTQQSKALTPGLWKDLLKYQTNVVENTGINDSNREEDDEENEDELSLDDEFALETTEPNSSILDNTDTNASQVTHQASGNNFVLDAIIQDKVLFSIESCEIITPSTNSMSPPAYGALEITSSKITFTKKGPDPPKAAVLNINDSIYENHDYLWACESFPSTTWSTDEIINVLRRNFHLRNTAVELFFSSRKSVFINLHNKNSAFRFFFVIRNVVKPPYLAPFLGMRPPKMVLKMIPPGSTTNSNITLAWQTREISNFEYLMHLNTIAGRSFNDLGQYPVFPWILADYTSSVLRLRESNTYRDLSWPMGAQNESQREMMQQKYEDLNSMFLQSQNSDIDMGPAMPPFHYGSHYSTAGFVMWYLMRAEPFTSLHVQLQDGKFDRSDRLFDSIDAAWKGCIHNASDVKELVPEFFYCPEIFENVNNLGLGVKSSTKKKVGDIALPPWAADPLEFVRLNRKALESEYVSKNLHHWIDLIFGYKQRPPHLMSGGNEATVDACNVFFHLTYAGAVDLDELLEKDKALYKQYVNQIAEFGQTPTQLFTERHVQRQSIENADIAWPIASVVLGADTIMKGDVLPDKPKKIICFKSYKVSTWPILLIALGSDKLVTVDSSRVLGNHFWQSLPPDVVPPYRFKIDAIAFELSNGLDTTGNSSLSSMMSSYSTVNSVKDKRIGVPFLNQVLISQPSLTTHEAEDDIAIASFLPKKDFLRAEKETKRTTVPSQSLGSNKSSKDYADISNLPSSDSMSTDDLSDVSSSTGRMSSTVPKKYVSPKKNSPHRGNNRKKIFQQQNSHNGVASSRAFQKRRTQGRAVDDHLSSQLFAVHPNSKLLFSCGYWDHSFKVTLVETGKLLQSINLHKDAVTCLTLATNYGQTWLVTGSRDCTLMIWDVSRRDSEHPIGNAPSHILYGHDDAVTSVSINADLDVVLSGSDDGTLILHGLRDGSYIRSILVGVPPNLRFPVPGSIAQADDGDERGSGHGASAPMAAASRRRISWVCITPESYVVVYLVDEHLLCTYTMNGRVVATKDVRERLYAFALSDDGQVILTGGENCLVIFRWVHTLELANDGPRKGLEAVLDGMVEEAEGTQQPMSSPIRSIFLPKQERHLIVGTDRGDIRVFAQDSDYLRQRLQRKLEEIGIL